MNEKLYILHVEDNAGDAALASSLLEAGGIAPAITRVQTAEDFIAALEQPRLDLIISDFSMPKFDGISALKLARERRPDVPFVFLSGTIGEEVAVRALKNGAMDYVLKDRVSRLVSCVQRAVNEAADQTRRRKIEAQLREQAMLLDRAQDAICLNDMAQNILYWNKGAERMYGWAGHEVLGRDSTELLFKHDPDNHALALKHLIRHGEWQGELRQTTKSGKNIITESRWTLMRDEGDRPKSILIINTDVTEKRQMEAQLLRTQRMETIGALAGGVAHDLNNALTPILMAAEMLDLEVTSPSGVRMLGILSASARRSAEMVKQILSFSRGVAGAHAPVEIHPLVTEMVQLSRKTFPARIEIVSRLPEGLPRVVGNATQLHQVLLNLCVNARDAMPEGGRLTITAEPVFMSAADLPQRHDLTAGQYLLLSVSDTGQGIPPDIREKIFEPFFTTKDVGKGTGIGLSTVIGIVKTHGGFLDLTSEVGKGTTFRVYLPIRPTPAQSGAQIN